MKTKKKLTKPKRSTRARAGGRPATASLRFVEHVQELRRRLYFIVGSIALWAVAAYGVQQHLVGILLRPAKGEHFIYTSPGGGIDFLFRICLYSGLVFSLPVIVYHTLRFIEPLITKGRRGSSCWGSFTSGVLAAAGIIFGYYLGLPAALHFLLHQFTTVQIQPLVTIQSYLGFVIVYMVGSAMLFQVPLLLLFINRVRPLKPRRLFHYERWVILAAFVLSGLMNPTPNIISQLLVAGPFIIMYQLGIGLIWLTNRQRRPSTVAVLYQQDVQAQADRHSKASSLQPLLTPRPLVVPQQPVASPRGAAVMAPAARIPATGSGGEPGTGSNAFALAARAANPAR